jgi:hypothetical protein
MAETALLHAQTAAAEASQRWQLTLSASVVEDTSTVAALRAQLESLRGVANAASLRADALSAAVVRLGAGSDFRSPDVAGAVVDSAAATYAAALAEADTLRAERDSATAYAASLESELAATTGRVHMALAALGAPPLSTRGCRISSHCSGRGGVESCDARALTSVPPAILAQLETLRAEVTAHKAAAASSTAALATMTAALAATRDDLAQYRGLERSAQAAVMQSKSRAVKAEYAAASARSIEIAAQRALTDAQQQIRLLTIERDDALEAVRRITDVAVTHERRCSELQVAACEVCDMCVRQQEELAAARREAEAARNAACSSSTPSVLELTHVLEAAVHQQHQEQLAAVRAEATAAEARVKDLKVREQARRGRSADQYALGPELNLPV